MKVLRLIGGLDPGFGGPSVSSINSTIAAVREGVKTHFAFPTDPLQPQATENAIARLEGAAIPYTTFPLNAFPSALCRRWGISAGLARWIRREAGKFDIVHCHSAWVMPSLVTVFGGAGGAKTILSPHESLTDFDLSQASGAVTGFLKRRLKPRYLKSFDMFVMSSALEARDSINGDKGAAERTETIHHPVFDEREHEPLSRPAWRGPGLKIGFFGRLHRKKNLDILIRALARLPDDVSLTVGGEGLEADRLHRLAAELGVTGRIEWKGFVASADKTAFFDSIDMLAMPSDYECFGMAAAEALVEGCAALVSPETGVAEIIRAHNCGIVVAPDAGKIAAEIEKLRGDPDKMAHYSASATKAAAASLSFGAHGRAVKAAYRRLIGGTPGKAT